MGVSVAIQTLHILIISERCHCWSKLCAAAKVIDTPHSHLPYRTP